jgi:hypothetical protein
MNMNNNLKLFDIYCLAIQGKLNNKIQQFIIDINENTFWLYKEIKNLIYKIPSLMAYWNISIEGGSVVCRSTYDIPPLNIGNIDWIIWNIEIKFEYNSDTDLIESSIRLKINENERYLTLIECDLESCFRMLQRSTVISVFELENFWNQCLEYREIY